jgi:hypothetical protein
MNEFLYFLFGFICANAVLLAILWVKFAIFKTHQQYEFWDVRRELHNIKQHTGVVCALLACLMFASCTTPRSYQFAKYALHTGLEIAEEAGAFKERTFVLPTKWQSDTIVYYEGINKYLLTKQGKNIVFTFTPSRQNLQDTCLHLLKKKLHDNKASPTTPTFRR